MTFSASIVLLFYNHWELTHARLWELYQFVPDNIEVILFDNNSTELICKSGVAWWQTDMSTRFSIKYMRSDKNLSFGHAMNIGAKSAKSDILILLSNDVKITGDFISPIIERLSKDFRQFIGNEVYSHDTGWNTFSGNIFPYAAGYMLACTKNTWKDIGGFDLRYKKYDMEDVDISTQAIFSGYNLHALNSPYLTHLVAQTIGYNPEREKITKKNQKKFEEKWIK